MGNWYDKVVGETGHYFHELILPKTLALMDFSKTEAASLLDLACGQGVLARSLPDQVAYAGIDLSPTLIASAKKRTTREQTCFYVADATKKLPLEKKDFSHAALILALQNIAKPLEVLKNAANHLRPGGKLLIILNHPCFRIPRQSSWGIDPHTDIQYRRVDRYLSPMEIPIQTHPGKGASSTESLSFHHPLSAFSQWLYQAGFAIDLIQEWCSDKESQGKAARRENRSRAEFPLFLALRAIRSA